ncbi:UPF0182 family protein [candidate division KSB1 bacterium]|nr:UPF0182 family protein [candidate division KSB1 bacterium]
MYNIIILILIGIAVAFIFNGVSKRRLRNIILGAVLALITIAFFSLMSFYGEMLWFNSIGYSNRFWTVILAKLLSFGAGAVLGWIIVFILTFSIPSEKKYIRRIARIAGALIGAIITSNNWDVILRYFNQVPTNLKDPILARDASFYLFSLPFYDALFGFLLAASIISLIAAFLAVFLRTRGEGMEIQFDYPDVTEKTRSQRYRPLYISAAALIFVLAFDKILSRFHLLYSTWGAVMGPGWTDVNIRLHAYTLVIIVTALFGLLVLISPLRNRLIQVMQKRAGSEKRSPVYTLIGIGVTVLLIWFLVLTVIPGLFQWLRVEPNEITFEEPYIENNIKFTRFGFKLNNVEEREFPAAEKFTKDMVERNQNLFSNVRLWDYRALDAVYKQFQEIRLYYEFVDVDIDRYTINDMYRQVMVSAREMEIDNLPAQSQTFVNRRFKYTHGYGITLTTVNDFTPQGLPNLLIKDIPPKYEYPSLKVERPEIYYGELTNSHVIVNTEEEEFDFPRGEENVYVHYSGNGGVEISNIWRKFLFGWKFDGTRLFLSGYPASESRIMFHRQIEDRVKTLAPFLDFDDDPYIVLANGKLYWIIDAYTSSKYFPYSEPFQSTEYIEYKEGNRTRVIKNIVAPYLDGVNYMRNSVKTVVDAYSGEVNFYIFDEEDPLIKVWDNIFPDMFKRKNEMPEELLKHVRYPIDMLLIQGLVYAKYHMSDPTVFYNQEDLWIRATEKYYNRVQPVEPYYIMWEIPGLDDPEYVLILPFTPKNRQVSIGWIAGMCDPGNYGRFLAYKFPKEKRVIGPQQVETKIDQDRFLSGQLTLWDQRGSNVIRGNVLAIPIEETLIYVEPIYLQAETAAYPELRLVIVMHNDILSYGESFEEALNGIFKESARELPAAEEQVARVSTTGELIQKANDAFENYIRLMGEKRFNDASKELESLQQALRQLSSQQGETQ